MYPSGCSTAVGSGDPMYGVEMGSNGHYLRAKED